MPVYTAIQIEPNKRYGGFMAIEKAGKNKHEREVWKVQCIYCKKIRIAEKGVIIKSKSCGCLSRERLPKIKPGDIFKGLKAIQKVGFRWEAECLICGKRVIRNPSSVRNAISCGCIRKKNVMPAIDTFEYFTDKQEDIPEDKKERGSLNLDPCWIWNGPISPVNGSLIFFKSDSYIGVPISAQKFSLNHFREISDRKGIPVPICENPLCVNPNHLKIISKNEYLMGYAFEELKKYFWKHVNKQENVPAHKQVHGSLSMEEEPCWLWEGKIVNKKDKNGAITIFTDIGHRHSILAHRFSWIVSTGEELNSRVYIIQKCNTPFCVNPAHLKKMSAKEYRNEYRYSTAI